MRTIQSAVLLSSLYLLQPTSLAAQNTPQVKIRTVTDTLVGGTGGVAVDRLGIIYVADFGERVYKVQPDGRVSIFATGLYGSSGNNIDSQGRLIQSNFSGNSISRIDRDGNATTMARGLTGPVGIAIDSADNLTVTNCRGNSLARVTPEGVVSAFAKSSLFNCPNGITLGPDGAYYVVNFSDGKMLRATGSDSVTLYATIPGGGNGHIAFARGEIYVTAFQTHLLYTVSLDGTVTKVAGTGRPSEVDGVGTSAAFTFPNGIAVAPTGDRLYVNDNLNRQPPTAEVRTVPKSIVRQITLPAFWQVLAAELSNGGLAAMEERYREWKSAPSTAALYTEIEINAFGYNLMNNGNLPAAKKLFELNAESYPNSFNAWDSLAESHMKSGNNDEAIRLYRKSLSLNPGNTNATDQLKTLGAQ